MDQDQVTEKAMYDNADKFIDLANEMSKTENYVRLYSEI